MLKYKQTECLQQSLSQLRAQIVIIIESKMTSIWTSQSEETLVAYYTRTKQRNRDRSILLLLINTW